MDEENTMHMMLKVVDQRNRTRYDTYTRQDVDIFDSVSDLRQFLLENYSAELSSPPDANSFRLGYIVGKNQRVSISNNSNLDEVYPSSKKLDHFMGRANPKERQRLKFVKGDKANTLCMKPCSMEVTKV